MKRTLLTYWPVLLTAAFALAVWYFWTVEHPSFLAYQEQLQLFLFDAEFWCERMVVPGGIARYVAEFFVQFCNNTMAGGWVMVVVLVVLQLLMWLTFRRRGVSVVWYPVSFLPALLVWYYLGDENVRFTFVVALIFAVVAMLSYPQKAGLWHRVATLLVMGGVLYWAAGPVVLVFALHVALIEAFVTRRYLLSVLSLFYAVACVVVSAAFVPYPLMRLFYGINYHFLLDQMQVMQGVIMLIVAILPFVAALLPEVERGRRWVVAVQVATVGVVALVVIPATLDEQKLEVLEYDFLVRQQKWETIIQKAERKVPSSPLTVASLNLALGMKGQLNERAMQFYQNGWQGAFPVFNKNFESSLMTAEIYYYLGLVNTAQRLDFEAIEAIPDNNKSARLVKRLAETNLINGQYEVARKYLLLLEKTLFYRKWAQETMALINDEKAIDSHPVYGRMRQLRLTDDFLFSEQEVDKIMGQLVMRNADNYLAIQYLLLLPQLEGNQQKYMIYRDFVRKTLEERQKGGEKHE